MTVSAAVLLLSVSGLSQNNTADDPDLQSWNDVTITAPLNKKFDLYFPLTLRFGNHIDRLNEARAGAGIVYKPVKQFSAASWYTFIRYRNSQGQFRTENRVTVRGVYKFPFKKVGVSHRSMLELRYRETGNTWRYRPAITIEKGLPETWGKGLKAFVTEDPFYDSASGRFSRNRISGGLSKEVNKHLTVEGYYLRQDDDFSGPRLVHVAGMAWRVRL